MSFIDSLQHTFAIYGMLGVFFIMLVENLGIPFPTEVGFLIAQSLIVHGSIHYVPAVLVITAGHVVGASIAYGIGRWGNHKTTAFFERSPKWLRAKQKLINWYYKYGNITVFGSRVFGYVRPWASLVAGFAKVPFGAFLLWTTLGSLVFSMVSISLTNYLVLVWRNFPELHILMVVVMFTLFFGLLTFELGRQTYDRFHRRK